MNQVLKEEKIEKATIRLLKPGLIETIIHDYSTWEAEDARQVAEINKRLSEGNPYVLLVDSGMFTTISKEARELSAQGELSSLTIAKALYVRTLGHRLVGHIYIKVNKPKIKTRVFDSREEALEWLEEMIKAH